MDHCPTTYYPQNCCAGVNDPPPLEWCCMPFTITVDATAVAINGFNSADLIAAIVATGLTCSNGSAFTAGAMLNQLDFGLKPCDGHYSPDGVPGNEVIATSSDAKLEFPAGGGEWRDLDSTGQQAFDLPPYESLNDFNLNVAEGSIVVISGNVCEQF